LSGSQAARRNVYEVASPWAMEGMTDSATSVHHAGCNFAREHWSTSHQDAVLFKWSAWYYGDRADSGMHTGGFLGCRG